MKFTVMGDSVESFVSKGVQRTSRRLVLLSQERDLSEQMIEWNLSPDAKLEDVEGNDVEKGCTVDVHVKEVVAIFGGKPRIRGEINARE
jgi:hypothetical protein